MKAGSSVGQASDSPGLKKRRRVLVIGGTGMLGSRLVRALDDQELSIRILSRRSRPRPEPDAGISYHLGDVTTGEGLAAALEGVDTVIHAARDLAGKADVEGTRRILDLGTRAGVEYLLFPSIVGVPDIPLRYYRRKVEAERLIRAGPLPWGIIRTTQFHEFVDELLSRFAALPGLLPVPRGFRIQSVAALEAAQRMAELIRDRRTGYAPELVGPETLELEDMAKQWIEARDARRLVLPVPVPGAAARAFRNGHATSADGERGAITWRQWLATR